MPDTNAHRCLACGAPLSAPVQGGKIRCPYCGTVNVVGPREKAKGNEILCPECGAVNPKDAQHCGRCGIKLEFNCPKCGAVNSYGTAFCVKCGVDVQGELQRLEEERRQAQEAIRRQQEEERRRQEEIQRRLEENGKKRKRRRRISWLVATAVLVLGIICVGVISFGSYYSNNLSPAAKQTNTVLAYKITAYSIQQTATAKYNTLFQDDFSDPNSGWEYYENENGSTSYESGGYQFTVLPPNWLIWNTLPDIFPSDVSLEVDADRLSVSGPDDNSFGFICRFEDNDNFYYLGINSSGYAAIYRRLQGELTIISNENGEWQEASGIYQYVSNHLRAECLGDTLTLYANGAKVAEAADGYLTGGQVGLAAGSFDTGGVSIFFDNFFVYRR